MITIKNRLENNNADRLIRSIFKTCRSEPYLSPRPKRELVEAYRDGRIFIALDKSAPVGWIMLIPYTYNFQELAAGYVTGKYRSRGLFTKLVKAGAEVSRTSVIVTFNESLEKHLKSKIGFDNTTFWEVLKLSKGKFLLNRLNIERLIAIKDHYRKGKPKYLLLKHDD